ncbi:MAG: N-acetylmuramoyl-L-alanine amidase [Aerococcus sp.]|nr:N-acetylmuramoyl-L-alanine amidase [Aerococcus sp.]MDO4681076.1 N-acetylmuramoyl-L-alanine amidase [Aerococcus sp.]
MAKYQIEQRYTIPAGVAGNYRKGRPEGVVIHSNGNTNDSLEGEINYMTAHYGNAFTHAWCDNQRIIEISNTDKACWGAGPAANARFVQIEIVESSRLTDKQHQEAIDRQCFWAAMQCAYYGLEPTDATKNGQGTIWTHAAVSKFLGGTDHMDPLAYIARHGVTWQEMFNQIRGYWQELKAGKDGSALLGIHEKQGDNVQYKNSQPKTYATQSGKVPSTKFKVGTAVTFTKIATHWIAVKHSDGKISKGDPISTHDKAQKWTVTANNADGSVSVQCGTKAVFYAYDRDLEAKDHGLYHVQTGAFSNPQNAENQKEALKKQGYNDAFVVKK